MLDFVKIKKAVEMFLEGIGEDINRDGLLDTPDRVFRMCEEIFSKQSVEKDECVLKEFRSPYSGIILQRDIAFYSMCEHHLLPFFGKAHVAYVPNEKIVGLSKISRVVDMFSRRLQIQENLCTQIAEFLLDGLKAKGTMVVIEAEHVCMTMRGVKKPGSRTVTVAKCGVFNIDRSLEAEFYNMFRGF